MMALSPELVAELEILSLVGASSTHEGIKVHKAAGPVAIAAAARLHHKGLLTQVDGGYLTSLGLDARAHVEGVLTILTTA
jgi:uncharacterized protein (TIGR02647 family)